ncbi:hypothetical protein [Mycobacteroides abscessus]|uniref:hypothetical protein n=1 Tax=Mycobacteroides abscessus TaxID=36809 RepID=UPI000D9D87C0|nr:hypothetical protein [Mycobacteroides abscessus]SPX74141.1 Uncharacterised protein [Mycobacteroides abscessus]
MSDGQSVTLELNKRAKEDRPYEIQIRRDRRRKWRNHVTAAMFVTFILALALFYISMVKNKDAQILTWVFNVMRDKIESPNALTAVGLAFGGCASLNIALAYQNNEIGRRGVETSIWRQSLGSVMDSTVVFGYCAALLYLICGKDRSVPVAVVIVGIALLTGAIGFSCQNQTTPRDRAKAHYASYKRRMELRTWKHRVTRLYGVPLQEVPPARRATLIAQSRVIGSLALVGVAVLITALYLAGLRHIWVYASVSVASTIFTAILTSTGQMVLMTEWMPGNSSGVAYQLSKWWCRIGHTILILFLGAMTLTGFSGALKQSDATYALMAFGGLLGVSIQYLAVSLWTKGKRSLLIQFISRPIWYHINRQYRASLDLQDATLKRIVQEVDSERKALPQ